MYVASQYCNWDVILSLITYAYKTGNHEPTGYSPFYVVYVRLPLYFLHALLPLPPHNIEKICRKFSVVLKDLAAFLGLAHFARKKSKKYVTILK